MKVNLKKIGAIVAGATILASSVAFAGLMYQSTELVNSNGAPTVQIVVGENAAASDGVAAAEIAAKIASEAFKTTTLTASVSGEASCGAASSGGSTECTVTDEKVKLEFTVPGVAAAGSYTVKPLINEYTDRALEDRSLGASNEYNASISETSADAHPFADGSGGYLASQTQAGVFRIGSSLYSGFADYTVEDKDSSKTFKEEQKVFTRSSTKWQSGSSTIEGKVHNLVYQLKFFDGGSGNYGIPQCTQSTNSSYSLCSATDSERFETHKTPIMFAGSEWVVTKLDAADTTAANQSHLYLGGELDLAKESVSGIVNVGDVLEAQGGYTVRLDDIKSGNTAAEQSAIVSILDSNGEVLKQTTVAPGSTSSISVAGDKILVRVYKTAPGYTYGAKWADMAIVKNELVLKDNNYPEVNGENKVNKDAEWRVRLAWKRKETLAQASNSNYTDSLRSVLLYKESATSFLEEDEGFGLIEDPAGYRFTYKGLDLDPSSSDDYDTLKIAVHKSDDFTYKVSGSDTTYTVDATANRFDSYLEVTTTVEDGFSTSAGSGDRLVVLFGNGTGVYNPVNDSATGYTSSQVLVPGTILLRQQGGNNEWLYLSRTNDTAVDVEYGVAGVRKTINESGALRLGYCGDVSYNGTVGVPGYTGTPKTFHALGRANANLTTGVATTGGANSTYCVALSEDAGVGQSEQYPVAWMFAYNITKKDLSEDMGLYQKGKATFAGVVPFSGLGSTNFDTYETTVQRDVAVGFVSSRGSILDTYDDENVELKVAKRVAHAQFLLAPSVADASSTATQVWTGAVGDETTISGTGGVKVKVADITYTPGSVSAGPGATPSVDMSGVSAVILPDGTETVESVEPFGYDNFPSALVVLDKDVSSDSVVTVGGPAVNTKTAELLQGADAPLDENNKVLVWEASEGKAVVVAGWNAEDTLSAAREFIAALQSN